METRTEFKTLRNTMAVPQSIIYNGRQFVLGENAEQTFDSVIADKFLAKCYPVVVDVAQEVGNEVIKEEQKQYEWVANITGNPAAPDKVMGKKYSRDSFKWLEIELKNPNKAPRTLTRTHKGGHLSYTAKDGGLVQQSIPSSDWKILPFRRVQMPTAIAEWFVKRDGTSGDGRGACIMSRPQSSFEPDMSWPLDEMRNYGRLLNPGMDLGQDEGMIADRVKKNVAKLAKTEKGKEMTEDQLKAELKSQLKEALRVAKQAFFHSLYFFLVDPQYTLPTRKEYNEFVTGKAEDEVTEDDLDAILARTEASVNKMSSSAVSTIE